MSVFLSLLGVTMMVAGLAAMYSGSLFVGIERGWTMVVAGAIGFSAGAILLGLSAALRRLTQMERALRQLTVAASRHADSGTIEAEPAGPLQDSIVASAQDQPDAAAPGGSPASKEGTPEHEAATEPSDRLGQSGGTKPPPDKVVGTYKAGGNSYVMYADGSIRAETPSGEHRFASMDEFKAFMLTGTLRAQPPEETQKIGPPEEGDQASGRPAALSAKA